MPLSDAQLSALQPAAKPYKISDSAGLYILVTPGGSKLWGLAYRFQGKQKLLALGAYPDVLIGEARRACDAARKLLKDGGDPAEKRKSEKRKARVAAGHTFRSVADEWFET